MSLRARLFRFAALAILALGLPAPSAEAQSDQGIGGTGAPIARADDRGIGGTGFYGAITGFGSIVVNGRHIRYSAATPLFIDGERSPVGALRVGQIVQVVGYGRALNARRIEITHEVVGAVASIGDGGKSMVVLGQMVILPAGGHAPEIGARVAVDGLRRPDGAIVATLVSPGPGRIDQVVGTMRRDRNGEPAISGLPIRGLKAPAPLGARVVVRGFAAGDGLWASQSIAAPVLVRAPGVSTWSVESYFVREGGVLALGDGLTARADASAIARLAALADRSGRGIVELSLDRTGALSVRGVAPSSGAPGAPGGGGPPGVAGPHGGQGHAGGGAGR